MCSYILNGLVPLPSGLSYLDEVGASLLAADVVLLLGRLKGQQLLGDTQVALQDGLLYPRLPAPLHLILESTGGTQQRIRNAA